MLIMIIRLCSSPEEVSRGHFENNIPLLVKHFNYSFVKLEFPFIALRLHRDTKFSQH